MNGTDHHLRWPAERFYWAVLDASSLPRSMGIPEQALGYLLEAQVPEPLEALHAIYRPLPGKRYLACAIPRETLRSEVAHGARTLTPETLPACIDAVIDPAELNLLTGSFRPAELVQREHRFRLQLAGIAALCLALLLVGFERRILAARLQQTEVLARTATLLESDLGYGRGSIPATLRLEGELRALRQTRETDPAPTASAGDVTQSLGEVLSRWPSVAVETEAFHLANDGILLKAEVPSSDEAQALATALASVPGFSVGIPSIRSSNDSVRTEINWSRHREASR